CRPATSTGSRPAALSSGCWPLAGDRGIIRHIILSDQHYTMSTNPRRNRPNRRVQGSQPVEAGILSEQFSGLALAFGSTLLFVGYEVNGLVEIVIYPRYRFSSDDRVQGH